MIDTSEPAAQSQDTQNEANQSSITAERFLLNKNFKSNQFRLNLPIPALEEEGSQSKKPKVQ